MGADRVVMVLGDSVRLGYYRHVFRPLDRPGIRFIDPEIETWDSRAAVQEMENWLAMADHFDVIHFNFGLHDIRHYKPGVIGVPIDEYAANLEIVGRRFLATGARVIFATTTPVVPPTNFDRRPEDVIAYNAAARTVMDRLGIPVNDLWEIGQAAITADIANTYDGTHFIYPVSQQLGAQVVRYITDVPKVEPASDGSGVWVDSWPACRFHVQTSTDLKNWTTSELLLPDVLYREFWPGNPNEFFLQVEVAP
ncbi:MAG: SGNH/GDSL hydrolase family protein [Verrucomicrobiae bacterium]|nr:SGNH/GDSL hydrolase family protein [Verrucomicrobiae bacterium]